MNFVANNQRFCVRSLCEEKSCDFITIFVCLFGSSNVRIELVLVWCKFLITYENICESINNTHRHTHTHTV